MPDEEFEVLSEEVVRAHVHKPEERSEELRHVLSMQEAQTLYH
jgi:hypothetical protein